jgi:transposase InsO family protein
VLTRAQMVRLLSESDDGSGAVRLSPELALADVDQAPILDNARVFLQALKEAGGTKATGRQSLTRAFVAAMLDRFRLEPGHAEDLREYSKVSRRCCERRGAVNHERVERLWRREGLNVPQRQPKRGRLSLNDGSCVRLRPAHRRHVWSYDFIEDGTREGRPLHVLTIVDESTRECLAIDNRQEADQRRRAGTVDAVVCRPWRAGLHPLEQRPGAHSQTRPAMAGTSGREGTAHRAGKSLGEWPQL